MDTKVTDPVCGMRIEPSQAAAESNYQGQTYYFCSEECKQQFEKESSRFMRAISEETPAETGSSPKAPKKNQGHDHS